MANKIKLSWQELPDRMKLKLSKFHYDNNIPGSLWKWAIKELKATQITYYDVNRRYQDWFEVDEEDWTLMLLKWG